MYQEELIVQLINRPNTFIGDAPIDVDNCQWVRSNSGRSNVYFAKNNYDYPTYSIYVRDVSNEQASQRAHDIFKEVRNWTDATSALLASRVPHFMGRDVHDRSVYMFHIEFQTGGY